MLFNIHSFVIEIKIECITNDDILFLHVSVLFDLLLKNTFPTYHYCYLVIVNNCKIE